MPERPDADALTEARALAASLDGIALRHDVTLQR